LAARGLGSDYELLWVAFRDGQDEPGWESRDYDWRSACFARLAEKEPAWLRDRLAQQLLTSPNKFLAETAASTLAKNRRLDCVPVLMRYALLGRKECLKALEQMGVPQVAMSLAARMEYDWQAGRLARGGIFLELLPGPSPPAYETRYLPRRPKGIKVPPDMRRRLVRILGADAGNQLDAWYKLYEKTSSLLPSPLSSSVRAEVDTIVKCWLKWRDALARDAERQPIVQYERTRRNMLRDGYGRDLAAIEPWLQKLGSGQGVKQPAQGDDLYPAFLRFREHYNQAGKEVAIPGAKWDVPTTKAWVDEVDRYVRRVDEAITADTLKHE
jgi:hypothetical protein